MNLIGFAFTKLHAEKVSAMAKKVAKVNDIHITNVEKEEVPIQMKTDAYRISFRFVLTYNDKDAKKETKLGDVIIEGYIITSLNENEGKEFFKSWKKKEIPESFRPAIFSLIMKKCSPKAIDLEDTVALPFHVPIVPQLRFNNSEK
jgi:hypothetical protein